MELLSIDMGSKEFSNKGILLYGKCVAMQFEKILKMLSKDNILLAACLQEHHMDNLGFKLSTLLRYQPINAITVLTIDGSPHCVQMHFLAEQAKTLTGKDLSVRHFVIEEGELCEITSDAVKKARHLSHIEVKK